MFLRNAFWNAGGNLVRQGALAIQELGVRLFLPPVMVGVWELANLIRRVGNIWDLGFLGAAQRDLPALRGLAQRDEEYAYRSTTFVAQLVAKFIVAVAVAGWVAVRWQQYGGQQQLAIAAALAMLILTAVIETLTVFFQTAERYAALSRITMAASVLTAAATIGGTWRWGVSGLLIASVCGLVVYAGLLARSLRREDLAVRWVVRGDLFRRMAGFAVPLKVADYPLGMLTELDALIVTRFFGLGPLAIYATAKMLVTQAVQATSWLALVLVMRINNLGIHEANRKQLGTDIRRYLLVVDLVLLPVLIVALSVVAPLVIARFIPAYAESVRLLPFMLLTMYFVPQTTVVRNLWILDRRIWPLAVSNIVGLAAGVVCIGTGIAVWGFQLRVVAVGYLFAHVVYYGWIMATVGRQTFGERGALEVVTHAVGSCVYVAAVIAFLQANTPATPGAQLLRAMMSVAALLPLVAYGLWRSQLVQYATSTLGVPTTLEVPAGSRVER
jgi:O-antigen/teichoic acid export membrane protein